MFNFSPSPSPLQFVRDRTTANRLVVGASYACVLHEEGGRGGGGGTRARWGRHRCLNLTRVIEPINMEKLLSVFFVLLLLNNSGTASAAVTCLSDSLLQGSGCAPAVCARVRARVWAATCAFTLVTVLSAPSGTLSHRGTALSASRLNLKKKKSKPRSSSATGLFFFCVCVFSNK